MINYDSVTNVQPGEVVVSSFGGSCSEWSTPLTYTPPMPTSESRTLVNPEVVSSWATSYSRENFSRIKALGLIKMTPYSTGRIETKKFIISQPGRSVLLGWPHCPDDSWWGEQVKAVGTYDSVFTIDDCVHPTYGSRTDSPEEHRVAKASAMSQCVRNSITTIDALTERAEGPETIRFIVSALSAVRKPLQTYKVLKARLMKDKTASAEMLADAWLQLRYAVMPIVFSIQDAMDLLNERGYLYTTDRGFAVVDAKAQPDLFELPGSHIRYDVTGNTVYRATCKALYSSSASKLLSLASINPFVTGWELLTTVL
jgi:hypothetical protein